MIGSTKGKPFLNVLEKINGGHNRTGLCKKIKLSCSPICVDTAPPIAGPTTIPRLKKFCKMEKSRFSSPLVDEIKPRRGVVGAPVCQNNIAAILQIQFQHPLASYLGAVGDEVLIFRDNFKVDQIGCE
jgi:hypothetical protein